MSAAVDLFTPEPELDRIHAIMGFVRLFKEQLKSASTQQERRELELAIKSYEAAAQPETTATR
ncbi:MAG: hypothetical protein JNL05_10405 [Flavobacteriales bacterium]|nr:hypothetical protein [Flavobacteriales bacterium]